MGWRRVKDLPILSKFLKFLHTNPESSHRMCEEVKVNTISKLRLQANFHKEEEEEEEDQTKELMNELTLFPPPISLPLLLETSKKKKTSPRKLR
jgi:hypothetical protein